MRRVWGLTVGTERGSIFLASLMLVAVMTLLGIALFNLAAIEAGLNAGDTASNQLLYCANAALGRTMVDTATGGRMDQITNLVGTGNALTFPAETVTLGSFTGFSCTTTVTFIDDQTSASALSTSPLTPRRLLIAVAQAPNGARRTARL